jgi:signal transduction histidine kinase
MTSQRSSVRATGPGDGAVRRAAASPPTRGDVAAIAPSARRGASAAGVALAAVAVAGLALAVAAAVRDRDAVTVAVAVVAGAAAAGALVARGRVRLAAALAGLALAHGAVGWTAAATPLALAGWLWLGLALPDGGSHDGGSHGGGLRGARRVVVGVGTGLAVVWTGWLAGHGAGPGRAVIVAASVGCAATITVAGLAACLRASAAGRAVLQWTAAGAVLATATAGVLAVSHALLSLPDRPGPVALAALALVPLGAAAGVAPRSARHAGRALTEAVVGAGLAVFVGAVYLVVVIGLGRAPVASERDLLGLSFVAAAVVAVLALPVRARLLEITARLLRQDGRTPEELVTGFGARMTRAVPMDELLLQLAESLRATLGPAGAEIWVGTGGTLARTASVPDRPAAQVVLGERELAVASRTRVAGNGWLAIWVPALLESRADARVRVAPIAHLGDLLGLIVVSRPADAVPYGEEDDRLLTDLARQVGLALHNVRLDSALQESLAELRRRNAELVASRARVVAAADESRRRIERNLHDGAQQHLVAVAVKLGLARQLLDDPVQTGELLTELRTDVQAAIDALRELAHGIYPPLLRERGLGGALRTAAARSTHPTEVDVQLPGRYPAEVETAVYFCCLEAMQNAGKHAGEGAEVMVEVRGDETALRFSVRDNGAGFAAGPAGGAGFVNMADRLGAIGGELTVRSEPGTGTTVSGVIPAGPPPGAGADTGAGRGV